MIGQGRSLRAEGPLAHIIGQLPIKIKKNSLLNQIIQKVEF
jgi:hypothetical protein